MAIEWPLFLHLCGAFLFVGGSVTAAILRLGAIRLRRPSEQAVLLRAVRPAAAVIGLGLLLTIAAGFWLAGRVDADYGDAWLTWTFALLGYLLVVGAIAGRRDRRTRELAERIAAADDRPTEELNRALRDRLSLALNLSMLLATLAIVALMVWRP
jgi:uncharacterized membrane protein